MSDITKIYCPRHTYELVTNFCQDPNCLQALCATCICEHSEFHHNNGTKPQFLNIKSAYSTIRQSIYNYSDACQSLLSRIREMDQQEREMKQNIRIQIQNYKNEVIEMVNKYFVSFHKQVEEQLIKKGEGHNKQLVLLQKILLQNKESLSQKSKLLIPQFINVSKNFYTNIKQNNEQLIKKAQSVLQKCSKVSNQLYFDRSILSKMQILLRKAMCIKNQGEAILKSKNSNFENVLTTINKTSKQSFIKNEAKQDLDHSTILLYINGHKADNLSKLQNSFTGRSSSVVKDNFHQPSSLMMNTIKSSNKSSLGRNNSNLITLKDIPNNMGFIYHPQMVISAPPRVSRAQQNNCLYRYQIKGQKKRQSRCQSNRKVENKENIIPQITKFNNIRDTMDFLNLPQKNRSSAIEDVQLFSQQFPQNSSQTISSTQEKFKQTQSQVFDQNVSEVKTIGISDKSKVSAKKMSKLIGDDKVKETLQCSVTKIISDQNLEDKVSRVNVHF